MANSSGRSLNFTPEALPKQPFYTAAGFVFVNASLFPLGPDEHLDVNSRILNAKTNGERREIIAQEPLTVAERL